MNKVLDIERLYNQQIRPAEDVPLGTFAFRKSFGMMAFAIGFTDEITARVLRHTADAKLTDSIQSQLLDRIQQTGLRNENLIVANDEFCQNIIQSYPNMDRVLNDDLVNLAVLSGLKRVHAIDPTSVPWAGVDTQMVPVFYNPLIEARQQMHMVGQTLTLAKGGIWQHTFNGDYYQILGGTNQASKNAEKFPPMVVYLDTEKNTWSRPLDQFLEKFEFRFAVQHSQPAVTAG